MWDINLKSVPTSRNPRISGICEKLMHNNGLIEMIADPISGHDLPTSDFLVDAASQDRLGEVIRIIGGTKRAGEIAGVSDEQVRRWRGGKAKPNFAGIAAMTYAAGKSLDWLATGHQHPKEPDILIKGPDGSTVMVEVKRSAEVQAEIPELALIPRLEAYVSAGPGAMGYGDDILENIGFPPEWLRRRNINPEFARILNVRGDSMEETIKNGDVLLVDTSIDEFRDNAIYVIIHGEMLLVKRVHKRMNGTYQLISDNPRYPPEEVSEADIHQLNIAGRVMWYGRLM